MPDIPNPAPSDTNPNPAPTMLTEAEVNARVEKARQEEKSKLYAEIQALQKKAQDAEQMTTSQLQALQQQLQEAKSQLEVLSKAKTATGDIDVKALINETSSTIRAELTARHNAETADLKARLDKMEAEAKQTKLNSVRQEVIAAAKGRIIQSMVRGDTEEAIRASAEEAKAEYERIVAENTNPAAPAAPVPPPPLNPRAAAGGNGVPPPVGLDGFKRITNPKEFAGKRDTLFADLKQRYG